ncbi:hypothetical protein ACFQBQ_10290 [Granulicella cerasi]|uniref:Uncharacterized protein n=1 Tax=Granulicella cerasi TaxID=741063 RepID=A0ABW1ZAN6_9BACT
MQHRQRVGVCVQRVEAVLDQVGLPAGQINENQRSLSRIVDHHVRLTVIEAQFNVVCVLGDDRQLRIRQHANALHRIQHGRRACSSPMHGAARRRRGSALLVVGVVILIGRSLRRGGRLSGVSTLNRRSVLLRNLGKCSSARERPTREKQLVVRVHCFNPL